MYRARTGRVVRGACIGWLALGPPLASAADVPAGGKPVEEFYGPLRARDLTPFGYLRLDMRPPFAGRTTPGSWSFESELAYQNTWAASPAVRKHLDGLPERRTLRPDDFTAIGGKADESYLVDLELAQFDLLLHRQLSPDWGAYLVLSGVNYGGGLLDGGIEDFHDQFGLRNYGRTGVPRGQVNIHFDLQQQQYTALDVEPRGGLLDPTVGVRYTGIALDSPWQLVLEGAAKLPLAGERQWLSTGRLDAGVQATLVRRSGRHALYSNAALVWYSGSDGSFPSAGRWLPTLVAGLESHVTRRMHSIVQFYVSPSVYDGDQTHLNSLVSTKYLLSLGLRHHRGRHLFSFAVTENLANYHNTPDIGLQLGWAYRASQ